MGVFWGLTDWEGNALGLFCEVLVVGFVWTGGGVKDWEMKNVSRLETGRVGLFLTWF